MPKATQRNHFRFFFGGLAAGGTVGIIGAGAADAAAGAIAGAAAGADVRAGLTGRYIGPETGGAGRGGDVGAGIAGMGWRETGAGTTAWGPPAGVAVAGGAAGGPDVAGGLFTAGAGMTGTGRGWACTCVAASGSGGTGGLAAADTVGSACSAGSSSGRSQESNSGGRLLTPPWCPAAVPRVSPLGARV